MPATDQNDFKPRKLRPLMVPAGFVHVPAPIYVFDRFTIRKSIKHETRDMPRTILGRVVIDERVVDGKTRPVAALKDRWNQTIWVDADPDEFALYLRLFELRGQTISLFGRIYEKERHWFIEHPEPMPSRWLDKPRPIYDLHAQTRMALERRTSEIIAESYLLDAKIQNEYRRSIADDEAFSQYMSASTRKLFQDEIKDRESLYVATHCRSIRDATAVARQALTAAHRPASKNDFDAGMDAIRRMAAVAVISERVKEGLRSRRDRLRSAENTTSPGLTAAAAADVPAAVNHYARHLPFPLTDEQYDACVDVLNDFKNGQPMRRLLSGDVGTGKTAVYAVAVAAMIDAGHRVAVILPSTLLAVQVAKKMAEFVPGAHMTVVAGSDSDPDQDAKLWVGTVGVQFKAVEDFGFCVIDEQQRFSRDQRECTMAEGAHLLEVTATCIPRTQALMDAHIMDVSRLRKCHVAKRIRTRIREDQDKARLLKDIHQDVRDGYAVMVVYPGKEISEGKNKLYSVKEFANTWEKQFPGRVAICHGGLSDEENNAAVEAVRSRTASVLVATSIIEVGIDIAGVKRMVVVQPDRFGLSTLHQLRGRCAREGGEGFCDLVLTGEITERARARLDYLSRTSDGFKLSEFDLNNRGGGDTDQDGHRQTGRLPPSPFKGYEPPPELVSQIALELTEVYENGIPKLDVVTVKTVPVAHAPTSEAAQRPRSDNLMAQVAQP